MTKWSLIKDWCNIIKSKPDCFLRENAIHTQLGTRNAWEMDGYPSRRYRITHHKGETPTIKLWDKSNGVYKCFDLTVIQYKILKKLYFGEFKTDEEYFIKN